MNRVDLQPRIRRFNRHWIVSGGRGAELPPRRERRTTENHDEEACGSGEPRPHLEDASSSE